MTMTCYLCAKPDTKLIATASGAAVCKRCRTDYLPEPEAKPLPEIRLEDLPKSVVNKAPDDGLREASDGTVLHYGKWLATPGDSGACILCGKPQRGERLAHWPCWNNTTGEAKDEAHKLAEAAGRP